MGFEPRSGGVIGGAGVNTLVGVVRNAVRGQERESPSDKPLRVGASSNIKLYPRGSAAPQIEGAEKQLQAAMPQIEEAERQMKAVEQVLAREQFSPEKIDQMFRIIEQNLTQGLPRTHQQMEMLEQQLKAFDQQLKALDYALRPQQ